MSDNAKHSRAQRFARAGLFTISWFLLTGQAHAQNTAAPKLPGAAAQKKTKRAIPDRVLQPFLWKIESEVPNYLFGTVHVAERRVLQLHPTVDRVFEKADAAYFEIDFRKAAAQDAAMLLPGTERLSETLPPELINRLRNRVHRYLPGMMDKKNYRATVWPLLVSQLDAQTRFRADPLDMRLFRRALRSSKVVGGLEDPALQLRELFKLNNEEQLEFVRSSLDSLDAAERKGEDQLMMTIGYYLRGDAADFHKFFLDDLKKGGMSEQLQKKVVQGLLLKRNRHMAREIARLLKEEPTRSHFFAVGTAHMLGEDSVLSYLTKANIKTTRVTE